ncbi:hypothetical protein BASA81_002487 [Batrachochytrium salamandrivorans]|nr:hypothetical protein BASA81_002487 [Batrachochytrium salamandrivorans]
MLRNWSLGSSSALNRAPSFGRSQSSSLFQQHSENETPELLKQRLLEELASAGRDPAHRQLKQFLKEYYCNKRFPAQFRLAIWAALLDHHPNPERDAKLCLEIRECEKNLQNQRVIKVDVERTRADLPDFRKPETQEFATLLLTYFCKSRNATYKQGLNEMLAPFVYLYLQAKANRPTTTGVEDGYGQVGMDHPEALVYLLFTTFLDRFLPHLYADDAPHPGQRNEMIALQCSFRFYELLLQYHDPELWQVLDHNKLKPELYSSSWFMTMFAQSTPIAQCYELWEQLLLGDTSLSGDFLLIPFLSVAYVCTNRGAFLHADPSDLPVLLTSKLSYHRRRTEGNELVLLADVLRPSISVANELRKHTPDVLLWEMRNTLQVIHKPPVGDDLHRLSTRFCATCSPEFFWMGLTGKLEDSTEIIVIDCRPSGEFARERVRARLVFNLGEEILQTPDALEHRLREIKDAVGSGKVLSTTTGPESLSRAWRWHVCVVGVSGPSVNNPSLEFDHVTGMAILHLVKHALPCVCVVEGDWQHLAMRCPNPERLILTIASPSTPPGKLQSILPPRSNAKPPPVLALEQSGVDGDGSDSDVDTGKSSVIVSRKSRGLPLPLSGEEDS